MDAGLAANQPHLANQSSINTIYANLSSTVTTMENSTTPKEGITVIRKFESCLGHGGFGIVLKALTNSSETAIIAVKFLFLTDMDDKGRKQILRESSITSKLEKHENVVQILGTVQKQLSTDDIQSIFTDDILKSENERQFRDVYIMKARRIKSIQATCVHMELCGENLSNWLHGRKDVENVCVQLQQMIIIKNLISGLKFLHENKIIHRDLKPANIMFSSANYKLPVKIGDFGLSRNIHSVESQTSPLSTSVGTKTYMAPEIRSGQYSCQADLYSLGLIIWEVVQFVDTTVFDKLVYDNNEGLVNDHALMGGVKDTIIGLTQRKTEDRVKSLCEVDKFSDSLGLEVWEKFLITSPMYVKNSAELELCLEYAKSGCSIVLSEGVFLGPFVLKQDNVSIRGVTGTLIRSDCTICLEVLGNDCNISDIKLAAGNIAIQISGFRNIIQNVELNGWNSIVVDGHENRLMNLDVKESSTGVKIKGCNNTIENVRLSNIKLCGIVVELESAENNISDISGCNLPWGIAVRGSNNHLSNIVLTKDDQKNYFRGVKLFSTGSNNTIQNLTCSGYFLANKDWGLLIGANNSVVMDSKCGPVHVNGKYNSLTNVDGGDLTVVGFCSKHVNLMKCSGIKIELKTRLETLTLSNCNYEQLVQIPSSLHSHFLKHSIIDFGKTDDDKKIKNSPIPVGVFFGSDRISAAAVVNGKFTNIYGPHPNTIAFSEEIYIGDTFQPKDAKIFPLKKILQQLDITTKYEWKKAEKHLRLEAIIALVLARIHQHITEELNSDHLLLVITIPSFSNMTFRRAFEDAIKIARINAHVARESCCLLAQKLTIGLSLPQRFEEVCVFVGGSSGGYVVSYVMQGNALKVPRIADNPQDFLRVDEEAWFLGGEMMHELKHMTQAIIWKHSDKYKMTLLHSLPKLTKKSIYDSSENDILLGATIISTYQCRENFKLQWDTTFPNCNIDTVFKSSLIVSPSVRLSPFRGVTHVCDTLNRPYKKNHTGDNLLITEREDLRKMIMSIGLSLF